MSRSLFSRSLRRFFILGLGFGDVVRGQYGAVAIEDEGNGLSPRYYMGLAEGALLARDGVCKSGDHSCDYPRFLIFWFLCINDLK